MGRLSILSGGLFVLPIAITIAILVGVETYQVSRGQVGLGPLTSSDGIQINTYCQKAYGVVPAPGRYILNPNQWGTTDPGQNNSLCMNITSFDNETYATPGTAPPFSATWMYPQGPESEPVHAFANAKLDMPRVIPVLLSDMSALSLDVKWSYALGDKAENSTDSSALDGISMNANVCVDMFLDASAGNAGETKASHYEVMVWLGRYGDATQPIGILNGALMTVLVNTTNFDLYYGPNSNGQDVFTWVAQGNTTDFVGDISHLITALSTRQGPVSTDYLGYVAFGSEALYSTRNVTFSVPHLEMDIVMAANT